MRGDEPMFAISEKQYIPPFWHFSYTAVASDALVSWCERGSDVSAGAARVDATKAASARGKSEGVICMV